MVNGKLEKGMSKQDARNYVSKKIAGQSYEEAKKTAKEIINAGICDNNPSPIVSIV